MRDVAQKIQGRIIHHRGQVLSLLVMGFFVGLLAGLTSCLYRVAIEMSEQFAVLMLSLERNGVVASFAVAAGWMAMAFLLGQLMRFMRHIRGGGVSQVEGELLGQISMNWKRVLYGMFFGGTLAAAMGFSLGRAGPSVQLGAAVGKGFSRMLGRHRIEEKYLMTAGASAGLSATFNAPLSGVMFALEEVHKNFSPLVLASAMIASLAADALAANLLGLRPLLHFKTMTSLPFGGYIHYLTFGCILGFAGSCFSAVVANGRGTYVRLFGFLKHFSVAVPALAALVVGPFLPLALGGGQSLVEALAEWSLPLSSLIVLFVVKFGFTALCSCSGSPGGIFLPMLSIGALLGAMYASAAVVLGLVPQTFACNFLIVGMAGFFAAVVRAPITSIILVLEMTGSLVHLLGVSTVVFAAHVVAELCGSRPIYESLLNRMLRVGRGPSIVATAGGNIVVDVGVCGSSAMDGRRIGEIPLPRGCLIVGIIRDGSEMLPDAGSVLRAGDRLVILAEERRALGIRDALRRLSGDGASGKGPRDTEENGMIGKNSSD